MESKSLRTAKTRAMKEEGWHVEQVRPATKEDIIHIRAMGGWVPMKYRPKEG